MAAVIGALVAAFLLQSAWAVYSQTQKPPGPLRTELMAERPALYRIFRLGDAVTLGLVAVALTRLVPPAWARAPHVLMADESVRLGPPPASESYLKAELIIDACKATGAEAVRLWDAVVAFTTVPGVLELSRPRPQRPKVPGLRW